MASLVDSEIGKDYEHCPKMKRDESNKNNQEGVNPKISRKFKRFPKYCTYRK